MSESLFYFCIKSFLNTGILSISMHWALDLHDEKKSIERRDN